MAILEVEVKTGGDDLRGGSWANLLVKVVRQAAPMRFDRFTQGRGLSGGSEYMRHPSVHRKLGNALDPPDASAEHKGVGEVALTQYETFADAEAQLGRFIDDVYNQKRLHWCSKGAS